ncbi:unnamed protein product [Enterobius vermicularis]|uniref:C2H2-type domain-containing protein n=1 Tax=Enterobius vermicularis TaxID=51028 RepID=A0A0N4UXU3_ENTVE|nr:unnamed protein product [Enterobius vermicularis]
MGQLAEFQQFQQTVLVNIALCGQWTVVDANTATMSMLHLSFSLFIVDYSNSRTLKASDPLMSGYQTRLKVRVAKNTTKFNEIFAAVVQTPKCPFTCSLCAASYEKHFQLHSHIALEHGKLLITCSQCNATSHSLWKTHVCKICRSFTNKLGEHEATHYQDKIGKGAIFECSRCYRSFNEYADLKNHISYAHQRRAAIKNYKCQVCGELFHSRHHRDQHLVSHFKTALNDIERDATHLEVLQSNQCPICCLILSSLRTFRLHIIYRHLIGDSLCTQPGEHSVAVVQDEKTHYNKDSNQNAEFSEGTATSNWMKLEDPETVKSDVPLVSFKNIPDREVKVEVNSNV